MFPLDPSWRVAFWGLLGAFIYGGPRFVTCIVHARETGAGSWFCALELLVVLIVGAIGSAAFGSLALTMLHLKDENAAAALVGLLVNRWAPAWIEKLGAPMERLLSPKVIEKDAAK